MSVSGIAHWTREFNCPLLESAQQLVHFCAVATCHYSWRPRIELDSSRGALVL